MNFLDGLLQHKMNLNFLKLWSAREIKHISDALGVCKHGGIYECPQQTLLIGEVAAVVGTASSTLNFILLFEVFLPKAAR